MSQFLFRVFICTSFMIGIFQSKVGFSDTDHVWSKKAFVNHLNETKRKSVENFNTTIEAMREKLQDNDLSKSELEMLDAWAKKLKNTQEIYLKKVMLYKNDATPKEVKNLKHDKLIGMYQARVSELETVLKAINDHIQKFNGE